MNTGLFTRTLQIAVLIGGGIVAEPSRANQALSTLFDDYWQSRMRHYPTWATYLGDHRYDHLLTDHSDSAYAQRAEELETFMQRLEAISQEGLSEADRLNHRLFARMLREAIEGVAFRDHLMPVTQQGGPPAEFAELPTYHPMRTERDVESYIARLSAFPDMIDQILANMRTGMAERLIPARVTMERVIPQLDELIVRDPRDHVLAGPATRLPEALTPDRREALASEIHLAIRDRVVPAYRTLRDFIRDRYLRSCRAGTGIWDLPDGEARYAYLIRQYTTTEMTPEEIHDLGKQALAQVHDDMRRIMLRMQFRGSLQTFMDALRLNPRYYYESGDSLMEGFRRICTAIDQKLPELFGRLPRQGYDLREIEAFRAAAAPAAYYYGAPDDGSRPAYFYVNTYRPETRPRYTMEALAYHEAVPGHHLQLTLQQELEDLPAFRRHGGYTAFVEGWALYAERLPLEVGLYRDPMSDFGRLTFDAWRSVRLIVDTGIHHFKWTREQAIEFFKENTALAENDIISEVERYIAWPGQALAYKIGELRISEIRLEAEQKLKDRFDIRRFHDALLDEGALPLDLLEAKMDDWLAIEERTTRMEQREARQSDSKKD